MNLFLFACAKSTPVAEPTAPVATPPETIEHAHSHGHAGQGGDHATMDHRFDDVEHWVQKFDNPDRDSWQKPKTVIDALSIEPGMTVADIGAGTGYFNPYYAAAVGPDGRVLALDIEPGMVAHMTQRAQTESTPQVEARLISQTEAGLEAQSVDRIVVVNTYHHISDRIRYFGELKTALKPGGSLAILDYTLEDHGKGPPIHARIAPEKVEAELTEAGWKRSETHELPVQYLLVFTPQG